MLSIMSNNVMDDVQSVEESTEVIRNSISCLFTELLVLIFCHLDVRSKGRAAQVCSSWRDAAYERRVWRGVEAKLHIRSSSPQLFASLVRRGISCVQVMFKIHHNIPCIGIVLTRCISFR